MAKEKNTENVSVEELKKPSQAQVDFMAMMEAYKKQNPKKYALKEEGFIKKLNSL